MKNYLIILFVVLVGCSSEKVEIIEETTVDQIIEISEPSIYDTLKGELKHGENITLLIEKVSQNKINSYNLAQAFGKVLNAENCRDGESLFIFLKYDSVEKVVYKKKVDILFSAKLIEDVWVAETLLVEVSYIPVVVKGIIGVTRSSLWESILASGGNDELAASFCNLLECQVDFTFSSREGDSFIVLYFKKIYNGELIGRSPVLMGIYYGIKSSGDAFYYPVNKMNHFSSDGQSALRKFLSSPVSYTRISSGFTSSRFHPILGYNRAHRGVDFAAPSGTPVSAISSGEVTLASYAGQAGISVRIKHSGNVESEYFHLKSIASGVRVGSRVEQGKIIGFVGSTGLSTGPHLHFGIKINGNHVNPLPVLEKSSGEPLPEEEKEDFAKVIRFYNILTDISEDIEQIQKQRYLISRILLN